MKMPFAALCAGLLLASGLARAEESQSLRVGDFEIYYSAVITDQLPEMIAKRYQLRRAPDRGMVQVTVRQLAGGKDNAIAAKVSGTAQSLGGQPKSLRFVEHRDASETLYLAEFPLTRPDTWRYVLKVSADGLAEQQITFQREVGQP